MRFAWLVLIAGCGRVAFDPLVDGSASDGAGPDAFGGPTGKVLSLDGVTGYATLDSVCASLTGSFTIEGWVRPAAVQSATSSIVPFATNTTIGGNGMMVLWDHQTQQLKYYDDVYTMRVVNPTLVPGDTWHYFALTYEPGHVVLYSDGVVFSDVQTPITTTSPCLVSFGQEYDGVGNPTDNMDGMLDEMSVWSIAKSQAEVVANMTANVAGNEPNLVALYRFDDGSGTDSTGHGNTATLVSTATIIALP